MIPGLALRASEEAELLGMDDDQLGEFAYDYVEVRRDYLAWTPATVDPAPGEADVHPPHMYGIPAHSEMVGGAMVKDNSESSERGADDGEKIEREKVAQAAAERTAVNGKEEV